MVLIGANRVENGGNAYALCAAPSGGSPADMGNVVSELGEREGRARTSSRERECRMEGVGDDGMMSVGGGVV